jgi:4a-hydroxytetrahydrobiopterin dehydratase
MTQELLNEQEITARLQGSQWALSGAEIIRDLEYDNFVAALAALDRVAAVAEAHNHHPDLLLHGWNKLRLTLTNHAAGGLTATDFEIAAKFDEVL